MCGKNTMCVREMTRKASPSPPQQCFFSDVPRSVSSVPRPVASPDRCVIRPAWPSYEKVYSLLSNGENDFFYLKKTINIQ